MNWLSPLFVPYLWKYIHLQLIKWLLHLWIDFDIFATNSNMSCDSSVGSASGLGFEAPGFESHRWSNDFRSSFNIFLIFTRNLVSGYLADNER